MDFQHLVYHLLLSSMLIDMFLILNEIVCVEKEPILVHMASLTKILDVPIHNLDEFSGGGGNCRDRFPTW